jgi:N-hydroxyarylamine O-acetyltransferase
MSFDGDPGPYLARLGLPPDAAATADRETLARLQRAHVTTVPFETFAVAGYPFDDRSGEGVDLSLPVLYEKVVERRRGGFCFELNGLFGWLLAAVGFDVTRVAARMLDAVTVPANHHPLVVHLDRPYLVDVGMGAPMLRGPVALGETTDPDPAGVAWQVAESDRPDAAYCLRYRGPGAGRGGEDDEDTTDDTAATTGEATDDTAAAAETDGWQTRYVFDTVPRSLSYFAATCDYLQSAPESGFTDTPVATIATADGHRKLKPGRLTVTHGPVTESRVVDEATYREELVRSFGLDLGTPAE